MRNEENRDSIGILKIKQFSFSTSQEAWEKLNEMFLRADESIFNPKSGGMISANSAYAYNIVINIRKAWMDPEFDFGYMFDYKFQKWTLLLNNYVNLNSLDLLRSQIRVAESKFSKNYNLAFSFDNTHTNGKGCLLAATFSRRLDLDIPIIIANLRSSEITKRLAFDLLLLQRIGEYIYGIDSTFMIQLNCNQMYCNVETAIMYHKHKKIKAVMKSFKAHNDVSKKWGELVLTSIDKFLTCKRSDIKYKVFLRTLRCLRPELFSTTTHVNACKPLKASTLVLPYDNIEYPENCITFSQRLVYRKKHKNETL